MISLLPSLSIRFVWPSAIDTSSLSSPSFSLLLLLFSDRGSEFEIAGNSEEGMGNALEKDT